MEAKFIEIISESEIQKIEKEIKLSKDLSMIERLFSLRKDVDFASEKRYNSGKNYNFPNPFLLGEENCNEIKESSVIREYCAILDYIERGDLIWKDAKV